MCSHPGYGREWLTETNVLAQSVALAAPGGLQEKGGYSYINVDSYWARKKILGPVMNALEDSDGIPSTRPKASRARRINDVTTLQAADPTKVVDEYGRWKANETRFPRGMQQVSAAVRSRGQKFGLYINPGVAVAAVKQQARIEGTNCTADQIAVKPYVGANRFWDCYKINWTHRCVGVQSCFVNRQDLLERCSSGILGCVPAFGRFSAFLSPGCGSNTASLAPNAS